MTTTRALLLIFACAALVGALEEPEAAGGFNTLRKITAANVATKEISP